MYLLSKITHFDIPESTHEHDNVDAKVILIHAKLSPESTSFLNKMVTGFKWQQDDYFQIVHEKNTNKSYSSLWAKTNLKLIWLFNITPEEVGLFLQLPKYMLYDLQGTKVYLSDTLDKIDANKALKAQVWNTLKVINID